MNLADAIRHAAQNAATPHDTQGGASDQKNAQVFNVDPDSAAGRTELAFDAVTAEPVFVPDAPASPVRVGNVVRLELFLGPEQLNGLFRAMIGTQHTMMTLREAASYLRVHPSVLEKLAREGELPAILIDGRWRFSKTSIDEWLTMQTFRKGAVSDVA